MTEPRQKQELELPHRLTLDARSRLSMTGVLEVESFDENAIVLATTRGTLIVRGTGLHLQMLSLEGGQVGVDGSIDSMSYEDPVPAGGFLRASSADGASAAPAGGTVRGRRCCSGFCAASSTICSARQDAASPR